MNIAQIEYSDTFVEELPTQDTLDRMEQLFTDRRREMITAKNRRIRLAAFDERFADENWQISDGRIRLANELTQAEMKLAENLSEIIEVAGQIYAEHAAAELKRIREIEAEKDRDNLPLLCGGCRQVFPLGKLTEGACPDCGTVVDWLKH